MRRLIRNCNCLMALVLFVLPLTSAGQVLQNDASGELNGLSLDLTNATIDLNRSGNAISQGVAEIYPNQVPAFSLGNQFTIDVQFTVAPTDTGIDRIQVVVPTDYTNLAITGLTINNSPLTSNCPAPGAGEYCTTLLGQQIGIDLGTRASVGITTAAIGLQADAPLVLGTANFVVAVDDVTSINVPPTNINAGDADGDPTDANSLTVDVTAGVVDLVNSTVEVDPAIVLADGTAFSTITVTLRDANNLPISGRAVTLASDRGASDLITQPLNPTDTNGIATGEIRSALAGTAVLSATDVGDSVVLPDQPQVLFTQGQVLELTKAASIPTVSVGDVVTYTVVIRNTANRVVSNVNIADSPAPVFSYISGSARLDGVALQDPTGNDPMNFVIGDIGSFTDANGNGVADLGESGYHQLSYSMVVGAGARNGNYDNTAFAYDVCASCTLSQPVSAEVEVTADALFDLGTIIGKVFYDRDGDGWQDRGEPGISGAMVALDNGTYALTDTDGHYHFPAIEPGQRLVKLNVNSIAGNAKTTNKLRQILTITPALLAKANFGVNYNYDSEQIGRDAEYGVMVEGAAETLPDHIIGSTQMLSVVVNGVDAPLPQGEISLANTDLNAVVHMGEDGAVEPLVFHFNFEEMPDPVISWELVVTNDQQQPVKNFTGDGQPPSELVWKNTAEISRVLKPGRVYFHQLAMNYDDSTHSTSARNMFGVNRSSAVSLELRGGAFVVDSAQLTKRARELLDETAKVISQYPDETIYIGGHTDTRGSEAYNKRLSEQRAQAALNYLTKTHALPTPRFVVVGFGETRPVASNSTETGRQHNRRVEIHGELTEIKRAEMYHVRRTPPQVLLNNETVTVNNRGRFKTVLSETDLAHFDIHLADESGRTVTTKIPMPRLDISKPSGTELIAFDTETMRNNAMSGTTLGTTPMSYQLVGETDPGNSVELNGTEVAVDDKGSFSTALALMEGDNQFVLAARNQHGFVRYANLRIQLQTSNDGEPVLVVAPIPKLILQLPPKGMPMRGAKLALPGFTEPGNRVSINDQEIEVEPSGQFFTSINLTRGSNRVVTEVTDQQGHTGVIEREIVFAGEGLFMMALADGQISQIRRDGNLRAAGADTDAEVRAEGRLALYLKGTVLGKYLLTAAFDTGRNEFDKLFDDLDQIENQRLITNIDPNTIYPVYGDDSTLVYDADTQGKLYLALDGEQVEAVVGNYALSFNDTELATYQRTLYGARAKYRSTRKTSAKESVTEADVFTAQVEQVPVRDELSATGGSLYFLSQRDIIEGSEQVTLLVHDQHTGLILQRIQQSRETDYDIKYREGRLWFRRPISTVVNDGVLIGLGILSGNPVTVQVNYETRVDGLEASTTGARVKQRLSDGRLNIGATHIQDDQVSTSYTLSGVDAEVKLKNTRLLVEYARSEGTDSLVFRSNDGGLNFSQPATANASAGDAFKFAVELDPGAWLGAPEKWLASTYYKQLDAGFISNGNFSAAGTDQFGGTMTYKLNPRNTFLFRFDSQTQDGLEDGVTHGLLQWRHERDRLVLETELQQQDALASANNPSDPNLPGPLEGTVAAARASYRWSDRMSTSLEHQATVSGSARSRTTGELELALTKKLSVAGRGSTGTDGEAFEVGASWELAEGRLYSMQRLLASDRSAATETTVVGAEAPFGAGGKIYTEYQWDRSGSARGARSITGIRRDWSVTEGLSLLLSGEHSTQQNLTLGENKQYAMIGGLSFQGCCGLSLSTKNEWRRQRGSVALDQFASVSLAELDMKYGLRLRGEYRHSSTDDLLQPAQSVEFDEASLGLALRPTHHDRLNMLFKLTHLESDATPTQVQTILDDSVSNILSVDWSYQISQHIEWVGKQAFKEKTTRLIDSFDFETNTSLLIQRLNVDLPWHLALGMEYRRLNQEESQDVRSGWLSEIMWERFEHMRFGVGYNFTDFSSDLRFDNDYSEYGWFIRAQGQY